MSSKCPRRTIALGPPFDDGTVPGEDIGSRVQFGDDGIRLVANETLTSERLAELLHENTIGCRPDDRCVERGIHAFDAGSLLGPLAPYLHRRPAVALREGEKA